MLIDVVLSGLLGISPSPNGTIYNGLGCEPYASYAGFTSPFSAKSPKFTFLVRRRYS